MQAVGFFMPKSVEKDAHSRKGSSFMESRIAILSIIISEREMSRAVNEILHEYADYVIGRMGIPYREKKVSVICVCLDAPQSVTSALSGKLGMLKGVTSSTTTEKRRA